jgi:hypothetical protein
MDLGCSCSWYDGDSADVCTVKVVKGRKEYKCCECDDVIVKGERHEYVRMLYDGSWSTYRTCIPCVNIRKDLWCGSSPIGCIRNEINDLYGFDYTKVPEDDDD